MVEIGSLRLIEREKQKKVSVMGLFGDKKEKRFNKVVDIATRELKPSLLKARDELGEEKFEKALLQPVVVGWLMGFVRAIVKAKKAEGVVAITAVVCGEVLGDAVGLQIETKIDEIHAGGQSGVDELVKMSKTGERVGERYLSDGFGYTGYELKGLIDMAARVFK